MIIEFRSNRIKKICENENKARKKYGAKLAKKLIQRIYQLQAFDNLNQIPHTPPFRKHKLKGDFDGCFSVDITAGYRLIFKPGLDSNEKKNINLNEINRIIIWKVVDYHD